MRSHRFPMDRQCGYNTIPPGGIPFPTGRYMKRVPNDVWKKHIKQGSAVRSLQKMDGKGDKSDEELEEQTLAAVEEPTSLQSLKDVKVVMDASDDEVVLFLLNCDLYVPSFAA
jgi:myo-inositol-1-phosphate synthase